MNIRGCTGVTDLGMVRFGKIQSESLQELVLDGCSNIGNLGVSFRMLVWST